MMKLIRAALAAAMMLVAAPAFAAGTTPFALAVQADTSGNPAAGCKLWFFVAGTVASPQSVFADFNLTQPLPNPLTCDQAARVPMHWLADGLIHLQLTDANGGVIIDTTMQVLGPSSGGGGGGGTVDPTTVASTGDVKFKYATTSISGWVRENANTIGNASSGATERANADTQSLFIYLYGVDTTLPVSGGRTGNALNDFNSGKQLTLPDMRGRVPAGTDAMGGSDSGRLGGTLLTTCRLSLGCGGGEGLHQLTAGEIPDLSSTTVSTFSLTSTSTVNNVVIGSPVTINIAGASSPIIAFAIGNPPSSGPLQSTATVPRINSLTNSTSGGAFGNGHNLIQPTMLGTFYIKL